MLDEMLVNITPYECRVALLLNEKVQELYLERVHARSLVGNIYKGKVTRVLPGMQAAFVDIGLEHAGFLHVAHIASSGEAADIRDHCYPGQELLVQVSRDPLGTKGARLSAHLSISSRYLIYMPSLTKHTLSKRILESADHKRFETLLETISFAKGGCILRTQVLYAPEINLEYDLKYIREVWDHIQVKAVKAKIGGCCYEELPLPMRVWRDRLAMLSHVQIDDKKMYYEMHDYVKKCFPDAAESINYYGSYKPIFDLCDVEKDIANALKAGCALPSGGYLLIEQTEAMVTIDVNTGAFVGKENAAETFLKTNLEAVAAIARQLRLRNLGGIIVLDFIDMEDENHRMIVHQALLTALSGDFAKTTVNAFSGLGLIEMSRQRVRESLEHTLCETCHHCRGQGSVKRLEVICMDIVRDIKRKFTPFEECSCTVIAAPMVVEQLISSSAIIKEALKHIELSDLIFQVDPMFQIERFEVLMV